MTEVIRLSAEQQSALNILKYITKEVIPFSLASSGMFSALGFDIYINDRTVEDSIFSTSVFPEIAPNFNLMQRGIQPHCSL